MTGFMYAVMKLRVSKHSCCYFQLEDSKSYEYREPEQAPISPPYAHYLSLQHDHKIDTLH
jgi:hypothetical protein